MSTRSKVTANVNARRVKRINNLLGVLSGPHDLATRSKERVREVIAAKHRSRRRRTEAS